MARPGYWLLAAGFWLLANSAGGQQPGNSRELGQLVQGLGTNTRVLMIGAHPDDEDTQLITWLARARHVETAYLSLTRGDGGQNLIGNELGAMLGMIRTEELLAARRIDGGRQYFTRAYDFGFSKSFDETLQRWPRDSILKDMVEIVRAFRPHVIVDVWAGTPADGHGHHQYAGVLGREVFDAAADSVRFPPSSVGGLKPWVTPKFYRGRRGNTATLTVNVGEYDPLSGQTFSEIATISRSQHRSQGQGALPQRGPRPDGVQLEVSRVSSLTARESDLFAGIDTSWNRFSALRLADSVRSAIDSLTAAERAVAQSVDLMHPATMVPSLARYARLATRATAGVPCATLDDADARTPACDAAMGDLALSLAATRRRAIAALLDAAAVTVEATANRELVAERDTAQVTVSVYNQGKIPVTLQSTTLLGQLTPGAVAISPRVVAPDSVVRRPLTFGGYVLSWPWWLRREPKGDTFNQSRGEMVIGEDRLFDSGVEVVLDIAGATVPVRAAPIVYRHADAVLGEVRRPIATVPEISVVLEHKVEYARASAPFDRTLRVFLHSAATAPRDVDVSLTLPAGLTADSSTRHITLGPAGDGNVYFRVRGRLPAGHDSIVASATSRGRKYEVGYVPIEYEHIRPLRSYRRSVLQLETVKVTYANLRVGYIRGVGDNVLPMLEQLGLSVVELDPATLPQTKLSQFTTIVLGPRAYQANPAAMAANTPLLMKFVRDGGTIVTQYGQQEMAQPGVLPFPITLSRTAERVTDETAQVRVLDPASPLLNAPNKIGEGDFADWVQERSLYMPSSFDKQYRALFSMHDPNEAPNDAAVLVAPVGKGVYVYTTLSFFRQLPAGHPGAARLFINLLSTDRRAALRPPVPTSTTVRP